jgi:hypothetical protein
MLTVEPSNRYAELERRRIGALTAQEARLAWGLEVQQGPEDLLVEDRSCPYVLLDVAR